jgi:molecular chaperone GrpE
LTKRKYEHKDDGDILKTVPESNQPEPLENAGKESPNIETAAEAVDIEAWKKSMDEEKEKADKYLNNWQRSQADFDNYRKRTEREKAEMGLNTTCEVVGKMLEVLDDLERALAFVPPTEKSAWAEGVRMTHKKLLNELEKLGMEEVCSIGKVFDPNYHEAIAHVQGEEDMVVGEIQKGYSLRGKLLRPSKVAVGEGNVKPEEAKADTNNSE